MALVNRSFQLDITPGAIPQVVKVSEYDVNRAYTVTLVDDGGVFEIPSGTTATVEGTIKDSPFSEAATVSGNTIVFELSESMTAYAGDAWVKIKLTKDSKPIQTAAFILRCDKAGAEADTIINAQGFQGQIDEAVAKRFDTNLKILVLGNSFAQDSFAYLPAVLGELLPGYKITYGVAYTDSFDPSDHLTAYNNGTKYTNWHLWRDDADHWSRYAGSGAKGQNLAGILGLYDWDIIYLQCVGSIGETMETSMMENNIVPAQQLLRIFQQTLTKPFVFLTGQWLSTVGETEADTLASYFRMRKAMEYVSDRLGVDGVIPVGAGIAFARTDATLDALGESGHMLYDWNSETKHGHQQAGLPALISAYVIAEYILRMMGRVKSVYTSTFVPSAENVTALNTTVMTHGDPVGVTTENILKAQEIAVAAVEHPDSVYGETDPSDGGGGGSGLTEGVKQALLDCFENVAWVNNHGQTYYDALYAALYPPVDVLSISAVFTQGSAVIYDTDSLDTLKQYLVVTATMTDSTTRTVTDYTLSGTLAVGTSVITVSYNGKTTTFNVTVAQASLLPAEYQQVEYIENPSNAYIVTSIPIPLGYMVHGKAYLSAKPSQAVNVCGGDNKGAIANWVNVSFCCYSAATENYAGTFYGSTNCFDALADLYASPLEFTTVHTASNISISLKNSGGEKSKTVSQSNVVAVDALNVFRASANAPNPFTGRIYLLEVLDTNNQATAKLIPCYRKADNVVGMYDIIGNAFYTSANSTAFTKGGDVA